MGACRLRSEKWTVENLPGRQGLVAFSPGHALQVRQFSGFHFQLRIEEVQQSRRPRLCFGFHRFQLTALCGSSADSKADTLTFSAV